MINISLNPTKLLFSTTRIEALNANGASSIGTSFFFHFKVNEQTFVPVLITNKHVIAGSIRGRFLLHESVTDEKTGERVPRTSSIPIQIDHFEQYWIGHPGDIDLCAMPFAPLQNSANSQGKNIFYTPLDESILPDQDILNDLSAMEEITMVGYPIGLWDDSNNFPILRRGITASHPALDFCNRPIGLVDIASFPGSSGSPIIILNEGAYRIREGAFTVGSRIIFLGVLFAGPQFTVNGNIQIVDIPTARTPLSQIDIPIHLGYYIRAKEILALKEHLFKILNIQEEVMTDNTDC